MNDIDRKMGEFDYRIWETENEEEEPVAGGKASFERIEEAVAGFLHQYDALVVEIWR